MLGPCIEGFENVSGEASGHLALRQRVGPCVCLHAGFGDLVQLQQVLPALEAYGVALCAVSYDTVETQDRISPPVRRKHTAATRPDQRADPRRSRRLRHCAEASSRDCAFVLDERGIIGQKRFHENYRERDTGIGLIAETLEIFSPGHEMGGEIVDDMVSARAWLDSPTYYPFQRLHLVAELAIAPGFHVYRRTISEGYVPLGIEVAVISGMDVKSGRWPSPRPYRVDGLDEQFLVHEGTICGLYPLVSRLRLGPGTTSSRPSFDIRCAVSPPAGHLRRSRWTCRRKKWLSLAGPCRPPGVDTFVTSWSPTSLE